MPIDLYRAPLSGPLLRRPHLQVVLQGLFLAGYVGLVALGWGMDTIPGVPADHPARR